MLEILNSKLHIRYTTYDIRKTYVIYILYDKVDFKFDASVKSPDA